MCLQTVVYSQSVGLEEQEKNIYLGRIVDISAALQQNLRNVLVTVVGRDVQRREPALARHIGVVVVLEQQRGRLCVILFGGNMQGGKAHLNSKKKLVIANKKGQQLFHSYKTLILILMLCLSISKRIFNKENIHRQKNPLENFFLHFCLVLFSLIKIQKGHYGNI